MKEYNLRFDPLLYHIQKNIAKNKNAIIIVNGGTGEGKTYAAIRFAIGFSKLYGTPFTVDENLDFNFKGLLKKMKDKQNTKPGTCFIFEEVGAMGGGASAYQWQSKANALFGSFLQTTRCKNRILIMTCPMFTNLDKKGRELCHIQWIMKGVNPQNKISAADCKLIQINRRTGKMYFKNLRFKYQKPGSNKKRRYKFLNMEFKIPPEEVYKRYEEIKDKYVDSIENIILADDDEKGNKIVYFQLCDKCGKEWHSPVKFPIKCPKCQKKREYPSKNGEITTTSQSEDAVNLNKSSLVANGV